jgi:hypothetical protein
LIPVGQQSRNGTEPLRDLKPQSFDEPQAFILPIYRGGARRRHSQEWMVNHEITLSLEKRLKIRVKIGHIDVWSTHRR